jgi:moderate conductance mechanosensitive channel
MNQNYMGNVVVWFKAHGLAVAVIVGATLLVLQGLALLHRRFLSKFQKEKPDAESQNLTQTLASATRWLATLIILGFSISLILNQAGLDMHRVSDKALDWALNNGLGIVLIILITFVALKAAGFASTRLAALSQHGTLDEEAQKRAHTVSAVVRWALRAVILAVAFVMVLGQLGVQIGPVIAAAGVIGLAVGFGAQNLVQDVISGFFILLEDQVRVGDVVQLNDKSGLVERITLRMVILRDFSGSVHYVRNGKIDVVTNMTKGYSHYVFEIGVAYRENVDEVFKVIAQLGRELQSDPEFKNDILEPIEIVGLDRFADSAVIVKARFKTKPVKQWRVGREFNRRLKMKFDELNIEMPFPHLTVYPGKDKKGDSPSLKLELNQGQVG